MRWLGRHISIRRLFILALMAFAVAVSASGGYLA